MIPDDDYPHPLGLHVTENRERELTAANQRIAELEKDKKRLDWLDDYVVRVQLVGHPPSWINCATIPIRSAIDQAMSLKSQ